MFQLWTENSEVVAFWTVLVRLHRAQAMAFTPDQIETATTTALGKTQITP